MRKIKILLPLSLLAFALLPLHSSAEEINYASIKDIRGDVLLIEYKGPAGSSFFTCNAGSGACEDHGKKSPSIFPEINFQTGYANSPDGRIGVVKKMNGVDVIGYEVYALGDDPRLLSTIPYAKTTESVLITPLNTHVFLFGPEGEVARFDLADKTLEVHKLSMKEFPLRTISPAGTFIGAYNYSAEAHMIWNLDNGEEFKIPGEQASFVEFSMDGQLAVFTDDKDGFENLYLADLTEQKPVAKRIFKEDFTVVDYLFLGGSLYYISNENGAYDWSLFRYEPKSGKKTFISEDVSYGDYMRRAGGKLAFLQIDGKNSNVVLYDSETDKAEIIEPVESSPAPEEIKRTVMRIGGSQAVLLRPELRRDQTGDLFIWLHGGPQRQTSPAYHSYLSYAVYDELLDRLVQGGAMVLKLDYPGSWGYGKDFIEMLNENIGKLDVESVVSAAEEMRDKRDVRRTYLVGNSYGGYLSLRTIAERPDLFTGAIGINGVYDWFTLISRIPSSPFANLFRGVPGIAGTDNNLSLYREASITARISNLEDKDILLVLGEKDSTVPTWQTKEFYYLAQAFGLNVKLASFPEEDHILRQRKTLDELCEKVADFADLRKVSCKN